VNCKLLGVVFNSAPIRSKPITVACGSLHGRVLRLDDLLALPSLGELAALL